MTSIASRRAKAAIRRALLKVRAIGSERYDERGADVAAPLSWEQAQVIDRTPEDLQRTGQELGEIANQLSALAGHLDQDRRCSECGERVRGEIGAAATIRHAAAQIQALAQQQRKLADQVDDAADQIGKPGATVWFGRNGEYA